MATSRYTRTPVLGVNYQYGSSQAVQTIRAAIKNGTLKYTTTFIHAYQRLDTLAGEVYNDGRYWWLIAAASDIGWGLQVPPNTQIIIPDLRNALALVG